MAADAASQTTISGGKRVTINKRSRHPWKGEAGTALQHERYGPHGMFAGWRVRLDNGQEVYVKPEELSCD